MSKFTAEQEFAFVAEQLTDKELRQIDRRLIDGRVEGLWYVNESCGCFYGWIGQLRGALNKESGVWDGVGFRNILLGKRRQDFLVNTTMTKLECEVVNIHQDNTPQNNDRAAWLHQLILDELKRRKQSA